MMTDTPGHFTAAFDPTGWPNPYIENMKASTNTTITTHTALIYHKIV